MENNSFNEINQQLDNFNPTNFDQFSKESKQKISDLIKDSIKTNSFINLTSNLEKISAFITQVNIQMGILKGVEVSPIKLFYDNIKQFAEQICLISNNHKQNLKPHIYLKLEDDLTNYLDNISKITKSLKNINKSLEAQNTDQGPLALKALILKLKLDTAKLLFDSFCQRRHKEIADRNLFPFYHQDQKKIRKLAPMLALHQEFATSNEIEAFDSNENIKNISAIFNRMRFDSLENTLKFYEYYKNIFIKKLIPSMLHGLITGVESDLYLKYFCETEELEDDKLKADKSQAKPKDDELNHDLLNDNNFGA